MTMPRAVDVRATDTIDGLEIVPLQFNGTIGNSTQVVSLNGTAQVRLDLLWSTTFTINMLIYHVSRLSSSMKPHIRTSVWLASRRMLQRLRTLCLGRRLNTPPD